MTSSIRKANLKDILILNKIIHAAYRTQASHFTEAHLIISPRATPDTLTLQIQQDTLFYVLEMEKVVVGCIQVEEIDGVCLLGQLAVDPNHQSKGIGKKLMELGMNVARERGYKEARIWVLEVRKDIIEWYEKMGFTWNGETLPFVHTNTHVKDLLFHVYVKKL